MNTFKKIGLGLGLGIFATTLGLGVFHGNRAAAVVGFTQQDITGATQFTFKAGSDGNDITVHIGTQTVDFHYYVPNDTTAQTSMTLLAQQAARGGGVGLKWISNPDTTFCVPTGVVRGHGGQLVNEIDIQPGNMKANAAGTALVSATGTLSAFAGTTPGTCLPAMSQSSTNTTPYQKTAAIAIPAGTTVTSASITQASLDSAKYSFSPDGHIITVTYTLGDGSQSQPITFTDNQPYDTNRNFAPDLSQFCTISDPNAKTPAYPGLTFGDNSQAEPTITFTSVEVPIITDAAGDCGWSTTAKAPGDTIPNPNAIAEEVFTWDGNNIDSLGTTNVIQLKPDTLDATTQYTGELYDTTGCTADNSTCNPCSGWAILLSDVPTSAGDSNGLLFQLSDTGSTPAVKGLIANCQATPAAGKVIRVALAIGAVDPNSPNGGATVPNSCEAGYTGPAHEFNWIFCKILAGMDGMFNTFNGMIEDQLNLCTGTSSTTQATCSNNILTDQVKQAWSVFRILATSLLVVLMLVMVISQAVGGGPFDAYTIRKMLPKLVIAAITIQISWYVFKWVIDVSNDFGNGIANLMYWPFGGASKLAFDNVIANVGSYAPVASVGLFAGLTLIAIFAGGLTIFGIGFLALSVIASLLVGLLVLLFRQILIILLMVFSPIALLAWILPGTQRYWKLWSDNFIKLLFMFPLIIAMLAAGRIFALIGSTTGTPILGLVIVFLGFFGPYWFLPKTFRWGGQAFGALATGAMAATKTARNYPARKAMEGAKDNRAYKAQERANRLATSQPGNRRMLDRVLAGEFNVTRQQGAARQRAFEKTLAEGDKVAKENVAAQLLRTGFENMRHGPATDAQGNRILEGQAGYVENKLDALQAWLEGRQYGGITPDDALMGYAFDQLAAFGDPDRIRAARRNSQGHEAVWSKALARNFGRMNEIARDFTLAPDLTNLSPRQYSTQDADTAEELLRQVQGHYVNDRETGQARALPAQEAEEQRARAVRFADEVFDNDLIYGDLGPQHRAVIDQLRALRNPNDVAVTAANNRRGTQATATLPDAGVLATQQQAQENLVQELYAPPTGGTPQAQQRRATVVRQFARQLDDPTQGPAYRQFLADRVQAHVGTSAAAANLNVELRREFSEHLQEGINQLEQELHTQGLTPAQIQGRVTAARAAAAQQLRTLFP